MIRVIQTMLDERESNTPPESAWTLNDLSTKDLEKVIRFIDSFDL